MLLHYRETLAVVRAKFAPRTFNADSAGHRYEVRFCEHCSNADRTNIAKTHNTLNNLTTEII